MPHSRAGLDRHSSAARLTAAIIGLLTVLAAILVTPRPALADGTSPVQTVDIDSGGPGDAFVTGGLPASNTTGSNGLPNWSRTVAHPISQENWNTYRFLESGYTIEHLQPGVQYEVRLYFCDWYWTQVGKRIFDVAINGTTVLHDFDVLATAVAAGFDGRYPGVERDFVVAADAAGTISVNLIRGSADQPLINAIVVHSPSTLEVDSGGPGDAFVTGGLPASNTTGSNGLPNWSRTVAHPISQENWNTYRFLESGYTIEHLQPGVQYEVRLYFCDWYWTQVGKRIFDVAINGTTVLHDFDVLATAVAAGFDGRYPGVERDFVVAADAAGTISVNLIRGPADQPLINALVVTTVD
ncbi:malectin domain-containing carbohydrate-binding protein [Dactylosporangium sp. CA-092794]|uniref:malectin domain-containing carbohydrate-binding protein n=1 Tax=Dactylosporangium sp. CA-092794 TaxID=3239929 RepID=UPI003D8C3EA6